MNTGMKDNQVSIQMILNISSTEGRLHFDHDVEDYC